MFRIFIVLLFHSAVVDARPVSYPGGWTFMTRNDVDRYSMHTHYSPSANYSIGARSEYWRDGGFFLQTVQLNYLVKRWNQRQSQANLYVQSGLGLAYSDSAEFDSDTSFAGFFGIAADWESRRFFVSYASRYTEAGRIASNFRQTARVGVAPYIADFGALHTWFMLQLTHFPESRNPITITPLVRFFKGPALLEAGISHRGDGLFNFIYRF